MTMHRALVIILAAIPFPVQGSNVCTVGCAPVSVLHSMVRASAGSPESPAGDLWFSQEVEWKYGKEGSPWNTTIKNPNGAEEYLLALRPLWAVEGGVVALEIVLASPSQPDVNILGERKNGVASPFVITVGELQKGLAHSKFGARRHFRADDVVLEVKIERFRLGRGVGSRSTYCADCKNLQELSMRITVESTEGAAAP